MRHKYDNTIKHLHYENFCLDVGRYYIIEVLKAKAETDKDKTPFKGMQKEKAFICGNIINSLIIHKYYLIF